MTVTKEARRRAESGTQCKPLQIFIPCGDPELVAAALNAAAGMANDLKAAVTLVYVNVVPFPLPLDRPDVNREHLGRALRRLCSAVSIPVRILIVLARDRQSAYRRLVPAGSLVVLGTRKRWWRTAEQDLARALRRDGHRVVLLTVEGSAGGSGGRCILPSPALEEVGSDHA